MSFKIPISDLTRQISPIRAELNEAIMRVVDSAQFILGPQLGEFEDDAARYAQVKYAVGVSNGTDALRLGLLALGVKPGEGVVLPTFTYYATAGAVASIGAVPVFVDIDPRTYTLDTGCLEQLLRKPKIKLSALIAVHLYGQCADMDMLKKNIKVRNPDR
jgi:dTDP-4-amino-4,6-dideoxygalactose transaminase